MGTVYLDEVRVFGCYEMVFNCSSIVPYPTASSAQEKRCKAYPPHTKHLQVSSTERGVKYSNGVVSYCLKLSYELSYGTV